MIYELPDTNSLPNYQRMVPLNRTQRRRLLVHASIWIGLGGIPIVVCCIYGPLTINWLIPSTASLLVAVVCGLCIALVDIALMYVFLFGLTLLHEGIAGAAAQTVDIMHVPRRSILAASLNVRGEHSGVLYAVTPTLVSTVQTGQLHTITYSPRARTLWACNALDQTEATRP